MCVFFFSSRRRHTRCGRDWSSDVCSSDLPRRELKKGRGFTDERFGRLWLFDRFDLLECENSQADVDLGNVVALCLEPLVLQFGGIKPVVVAEQLRQELAGARLIRSPRQRRLQRRLGARGATTV